MFKKIVSILFITSFVILTGCGVKESKLVIDEKSSPPIVISPTDTVNIYVRQDGGHRGCILVK